MTSLFPQLRLKLTIFGFLIILWESRSQGAKFGDPFWKQLDSWTPCSTTCDEGVQSSVIVCAQMNMQRSIEHINNSLCDHLPRPNWLSNRQCNLGRCDHHYVWRTEPWGPCSQTCGPAGRRRREVNCFYVKNDGSLSPTDAANCKEVPPPNHETCNIVDCPAEYVTGKWKKCIPPRGCGKLGRQNRKLTCVVYTYDGKSRIVRRGICMRIIMKLKKAPARSWQFCYDFKIDEKCRHLETLPPTITKSDITVVQMRRAKRLKLQVGQRAYIFPFTKIVVKCPVEHFYAQDVTWKHGGLVFKYTGRIKKRVKVDSRGRLRIRRFQMADHGEWVCMAGNKTKESIIMKVRSPSSGFQDWASRNFLWNEDMMSEDPKRVLLGRELVQWVETPWTACSRTCGADGQQVREVRCEKVDSRFYHILNESKCKEKMLPKPETHRICRTSKECPEWHLENANYDHCTNTCISIGKGQIEGKLTCLHQGRSIAHSSCDPTRKPPTECDNTQCNVMWKISAWSPCSRSCGGDGISARHILCVWATNGEPAGAHCYDQQIRIPNVIKVCSAPECRLKCVDLSPHCSKKKELCKFSVYRHQCCKSCMSKQ